MSDPLEEEFKKRFVQDDGAKSAPPAQKPEVHDIDYEEEEKDAERYSD